LAAGTSCAGPSGQLLVVYRDDVFLRVPVSATNLYPSTPKLPLAKLSTESIRDFVRLTSNAAAQAQQNTVAAPDHDSLPSEAESPLSKSHGSLEGEP
jgi:hypothetical protein